MRYFTQSFNIDQPTTALFQPALMRQHPNIVEIADYWGRCGSGIGVGSSAALSGRGEYYERRHFFSEISSHRKALLRETLTTQETLDFETALRQTMIDTKDPELLANHIFNKTSVKRLIDFSDCDIPTVCLSISPINLGRDNEFHPVRDTCGCSFHRHLESAIFGALKESIERQFLLKFWLSGQFTSKLDISYYRDSLGASGALPLLKALLSVGDVTAFDISDPAFPGKCVIVLYGTDDAQHSVRYCAGMAYSESTKFALEKAVYELWQTFRFIRDFHTSKNDINTIKDPYLHHFLCCNNYSTYLEITKTIRHSDSRSAPNKMPFNADTLRTAIIRSGTAGFLYIKPTTITRQPYFFCKYASPNAFMHMNNSRHINLKNNYSKVFLHKIDMKRQQTMVPFP